MHLRWPILPKVYVPYLIHFRLRYLQTYHWKEDLRSKQHALLQLKQFYQPVSNKPGHWLSCLLTGLRHCKRSHLNFECFCRSQYACPACKINTGEVYFKPRDDHCRCCCSKSRLKKFTMCYFMVTNIS
jgi:hypothetical protein